jgi:hypothetical protein
MYTLKLHDRSIKIGSIKGGQDKVFAALQPIWLGRWYLFQTFEEQDSVQDKAGEISQIRHLLDDTAEGQPNKVSKEPKDGKR